MGSLIGFALGYYVGLQEKPERLGELQRAIADILESREVQALLGSAQTAFKGVMARAGESGREGTDLARAWETIASSEEFKALVAGSTAFLEDMARRASEGVAEQTGRGSLDA